MLNYKYVLYKTWSLTCYGIEKLLFIYVPAYNLIHNTQNKDENIIKYYKK